MTATTPQFSDEELQEICNISDIISCECPAYLVGLLREVRKFRYYTASCPEDSPEAIVIHQWLEGEILRIEQMMSKTIYEFMQREDLLDENGQLVPRRLAQRTYQAALKQQEHEGFYR
jgi:hypothetical protein